MTVDVTGPATRVNPQRWPDVARIPQGPAAAVAGRAAAELLDRAVRRLPLRVHYPDGTVVGAADPTLPTMVVHDRRALTRRIGRSGLIGFGESYMAGEWESTDLAGLLTVLAGSLTDLVPAALQWLRPLVLKSPPGSHHNSRGHARRNISHHYDLSNELFAMFLDESLTYSSALFGSNPATFDMLTTAQHRKIDRLLDISGIGTGSRVLEIGTGWGELALRAAVRGAHVQSVTLSAQQQQLAQRRIADAGLTDRVNITLCDYRDVTGRYDAVVSVEMIEAVGRDFWSTYFRTLERLVAPGGRVAIQAITMPHDRMLASRNTHTWIQKYIFPGGMLPSTDAIMTLTGRHTCLRTLSMLSLRQDYAHTLRLWRQRFVQNRDSVAKLGFDPVFCRMWELYLAYSEAGFRSGYLDVYQWVFAPAGGQQ